MAASNPAPLTAEEKAQLEALQVKQLKYEQKLATEAEQARLASLQIARPVFDLLTAQAVKDAVQAALNDPALDFQVKQQIKQASDSINYNIGSLAASFNPTPPVLPATPPTA